MLKRMLLGIALVVALGAWAADGASDMAVKLFGKEDASKRVSTGAVFIDGLFIKGPYSVTREGNVILVNGRVASRFKVESAAEKAKAAADAAARAKAATDAAAAKQDPAASGGDVSDTAGAVIGSDATPTLPKGYASSESKGPSKFDEALSKRNAGGAGLDARLAAKKKAKELAEKSATGSFNSSATPQDPMALFEEADYTYTPPSKPEPKAVPFIRPASKASLKERLAVATRPAEEKKPATPTASTPRADAEDDSLATESFEGLTDAEITEYTKRFSTRRATIEKLLDGDGLVLLASGTSAAKVEKRPVMWRFIQSLESLLKASSASNLQSQWGRTLPRAYLQLIYDNRDSNTREMKTIILRVTREAKEAKERANSRI